MKANVITLERQTASDQQQLSHMREKMLSLMIADMRIIKNYLCEIKELGMELKKYKNQTI